MRRWKRIPLAVARRAALALTFHRRAVTLGVRVLALDTRGRVLLVRHTYLPGWYLPGGGVERGESARAAALRELREEAGLVVAGPLRLVGLFRNAAEGGRDHVALFRVDGLTATVDPRPASREIAEAGFFEPDALPEGVTPATLRRLRDLSAEGGLPAEDW